MRPESALGGSGSGAFRRWLTVLLGALIVTTTLRAGGVLPAVDPARKAEIASWLETAPSGFTPTFADRAFWGRWADSKPGVALIAEAKAKAAEPVPVLTEALYNEFKRSGGRDTFEKPFAARTERLGLFVYAEGLVDDGSRLPLIETELAAILDEPSWAVPADTADLSDWASGRTRVDLAASARAWSLATVDWLLGDRLRPETRARIRREVRERVLNPCLERIRARDRRDFWWMTATNNWNAVCHAGLIGAALLLDDDRSERAELVAAFEADTAYFIDGYTDDGFCEEGLSYWVYGFGHYVMGTEAIRRATGGRLDLLARPKVARIASFALRWEIANGVYAAFGDAWPEQKCPAWLHDFVAGRFRLGAPVGVTGFVYRHGLGAHLYTTTFDLCLPRPAWAAGAGLPLRDWFPDGGELVARQPVGGSGLSVALQGGHNGQSHNHNDVGSFVVVNAGVPVLTDLGVDAYVRDTFGPKRYTSEVMNSFGHPVPRVAGRLQRTGAEARGVTVRTEFTDERDLWELDMTRVYEAPGLERLTRTFIYTRGMGGRLEVVDRVRFGAPKAFGTALILRPDQTWERTAENRLLIQGKGAAVEVVYEAGWGRVLTTGTAPIHGIVPDMPARGTRIGFDLKEPATEAVIRLTITPAKPSVSISP